MPITAEDFHSFVKGKLRKHKFRALRCETDGIKFPSKLERSCYLALKSLQNQLIILFFLRQIQFDLPGGYKHFVDFAVFTPNYVHFIEAKGRDLAVGKMKREQVMQLYSVDIFVVKNARELTDLVLKNL